MRTPRISLALQVVHHDIWDYDTQSAPLLVACAATADRARRHLIVSKTGLLFTLNRVTGAPIFDVEGGRCRRATCPASGRRRPSRSRSSPSR
jgi:quinoprotein glucose dehydrogenase